MVKVFCSTNDSYRFFTVRKLVAMLTYLPRHQHNEIHMEVMLNCAECEEQLHLRYILSCVVLKFIGYV